MRYLPTWKAKPEVIEKLVKEVKGVIQTPNWTEQYKLGKWITVYVQNYFDMILLYDKLAECRFNLMLDTPLDAEELAVKFQLNFYWLRTLGDIYGKEEADYCES